MLTSRSGSKPSKLSCSPINVIKHYLSEKYETKVYRRQMTLRNNNADLCVDNFSYDRYNRLLKDKATSRTLSNCSIHKEWHKKVSDYKDTKRRKA